MSASPAGPACSSSECETICQLLRDVNDYSAAVSLWSRTQTSYRLGPQGMRSPPLPFDLIDSFICHYRA